MLLIPEKEQMMHNIRVSYPKVLNSYCLTDQQCSSVSTAQGELSGAVTV